MSKLAHVPFQSIAFDSAKLHLTASDRVQCEREFSTTLLERITRKLERYVPAGRHGDLVSFEASVAIEGAARELARHKDAGRFAIAAAELIELGAGTLASERDTARADAAVCFS